jgi:hypothetical protein
MKEMLQNQVERAAAEHDQRDERSVEPISARDQEQRQANGNGRQPPNRAEE